MQNDTKNSRKLSYEMYSSAPLDNATARTDARTFIQGQGPGLGLRWQGPGQGLESQVKDQDQDLNFVLKDSLRTRTTTLQ